MKLKLRIASAVLLASLGGVAALATTVPAPAPVAAKKFVSDKKHDYFGYFLPAAEVRVGKFVLRNFFIGGIDDFKTFEAGKSDKAFSAVMVEFDDVTSPRKTGEDGQEFYTNTIRVLATSYSVGNGKVTFTGIDKKLGAVTFDGVLDKDFFKKPAPDVPHPDDRPMLRGKLTVGGKAFSAAFNWFGGD